MMNKIHVIVNPVSASGKTFQRWKTIKEAIKAYFHECKYVFTERPLQATAIVRELLQSGYEMIIGIGGDGTLNEICNGYFRQDNSPVNQEAIIAFIPSGTGSDFSRAQKVPRDFIKSIKRIKELPYRRFDLGKIIFQKTGNVRYFINVADCGLGAEVIKTLNSSSYAGKIKKKRSSYLAALFKKLFSYKSKKLTVKTENEHFEEKILIAAIANSTTFGGGMIIAPDADFEDGLLNLTLIQEMSALEIIKNIPLLYNGKILKHRKIKSIPFKNAFFDSDEELALEIDGELSETTPFKVEVVPRAIPIKI